MSSINDPLGRVVSIDKANLDELSKIFGEDNLWRDFYRMGVASIDADLPESSPSPTPISTITPELEIIPYIKLMNKIQLLASLGKIEPKEAGRLVSMLDSPDPESWTLADGAIHQKLSEL